LPRIASITCWSSAGGGCSAGGDFGAVTDYDESGRIDCLGQNATAHVFAEDNHAGGVTQRPTVEFFPDARERTWLDDGAADGHVRIEVADVVNVRLAFREGDERADDSLEGGIGHGEDDVTGKKQRARNGQENIAEIIEHALFHLRARVIR